MLQRKTPLLIVSALASPASAQLLMYEPFNYGPAGTEISTADGAGGWLKVPSAATLEPTMVDGSLAYPALPFTPAGNRITGSSTGSGTLASSTHTVNGQPFLSAEEPTLYYSLLLNVTNVAGTATSAGSFIAGFRNNTSTNGLASFEGGAPLMIRQTASGSGLFQLGTGLTQETGDRTWDTANTYNAATGPLLLVLAYQFVSGGEDFARLYVNPDPTMSEAANAAALKVTATATDGHGIRDGKITNFFWRNNGSAPDGWDADELRISANWDGLWTTDVPGIWQGGTGNWSDSSKWSATTIPNTTFMPVQIDNGNAATSVVTLNQDATVRSLTLDAGETLNIDATRALTLTGTGTNTWNGVVNSSGTINAAVINVSGAGAELHYNAGTINVPKIQLSGGGKLIMSPGVNKTLKVASSSSVDVANGSKIDIADNKMIVSTGDIGSWNGTTYTGLTGLIQAGYNGGAWDGPGIITSRPDALNSLTTVAIATADQTGYAGGTFGGVSVVSGDVLLMYTYAGDANLDGTINPDDYANISFNDNDPSATGYYNGDFNLDGDINADDFALIDFNFNAQGAPFPTSGIATLSAVPEPAALGLLSIGAAMIGGRRRRHG